MLFGQTVLNGSTATKCTNCLKLNFNRCKVPRYRVSKAQTDDKVQSKKFDELLQVDALALDKQERYQKIDESAETVLELKEITKQFKGRKVLRSVNWTVESNERVGLVGWNGAGKTTQMHIVTGELQADTGTVLKKDGIKMAYLAQEFSVTTSNTLREEFLTIYDEHTRVLNRPAEIQAMMEDPEIANDTDRLAELLDDLETANQQVDQLAIIDMDYETLNSRIDDMLPQLGFKDTDADRLVASFSGGWQMRMCLGKILLQSPDLLLLDEPTNHLDLDAIFWLERYLKLLNIPMVIVSHDREFLNNVCTKIVETEEGVTRTYKGNYDEYLLQKQEFNANQFKEFREQQKRIKKLTDTVNRYSGTGQSGRAIKAQAELDEINKEIIKEPVRVKKSYFQFPTLDDQLQSLVVSVKGLTHGYGEQQLFSNANVSIYKGDKVAIIGPNGAGKSTLLRLIMQTEKPNEGEVTMGRGHVANYFQQNQAEVLDLGKGVMQTLEDASQEPRENVIKQLLGQLNFKGEDTQKKVSVLSGGEKARVAMAQFMLTSGSLLVLDEPTNHLDIPTKEVLEQAIQMFDGSVIAVSHDRYFLRKVCTKVVTVENGKLEDWGGDYEYYVNKNQKEKSKMEVKQKRQAKKQSSATQTKGKLTKAEKVYLKKQKAREFAEQSQLKARVKKAKKQNKKKK